MARRYTLKELLELPFGTRVWLHCWDEYSIDVTAFVEKFDMRWIDRYGFIKFFCGNSTFFCAESEFEDYGYGRTWEAWDGCPEGGDNGTQVHD